MVAFPSASRARRSAIEIQRSFQHPHDGERVRVRIGLHTGEALRKADDFFGHAVVMAARVAAEAHGNEILVSSLVKDLTAGIGTFNFGQPRTAKLKGIPGIHQLFPVQWSDHVQRSRSGDSLKGGLGQPRERTNLARCPCR